MRIFWVAAALVLMLPASTAVADDFASCAQDDNANIKLTGCTRLLVAHPGLAAAYSSRGDAAASLGDTVGAITDYTQAIALDPKLAVAFYNRGLAHLAEAEADLAAADFDQAIALDGVDATAYNGRAMANAAMGRPEAADADFARAVALDPAYARAYLSRATFNLRRGRFAAALADFDSVLRLHPGDQDASLGRALAGQHAALPDPEVAGSVTGSGAAGESPELDLGLAIPSQPAKGWLARRARASRKHRDALLPDAATGGPDLHIILNR